MDSKQLEDVFRTFQPLGLNPKVAAAVTLAAALGPMLAKLREWLAEQRHSRKAELEWLLQALERPALRQSRYLVEQAYSIYIKTILGYEKLEPLLDFPNPSEAIPRYCSNKDYVDIDEPSRKFLYKHEYRGIWWRETRRKLSLITYTACCSVAALVGLQSYKMHSLFTMSIVNLPVALFFVWGLLALDKFETYVRVTKLVEGEKAGGFWPRAAMFVELWAAIRWPRTVVKKIRASVTSSLRMTRSRRSRLRA